ncbi:MAG: WxcM-like domain-containing protein [Spirosomataceae bacterium]
MRIWQGDKFQDERGVLFHNNGLDLTKVKRTYIIENESTELIRGWRGHKIESRWFICVKGSVRVWVILLQNLEEKNSSDNIMTCFDLHENTIDCLEIPPGYATAFQSLVDSSRLQCFSDYKVGEVVDDFLFPITQAKIYESV